MGGERRATVALVIEGLLFPANVSLPWDAHLVIIAFAGILPIAFAWLLGLVALGTKRWIMKR